jgi:hypothetical protein
MKREILVGSKVWFRTAWDNVILYGEYVLDKTKIRL